jgi:archaellum component FlaG (FlaF/FlaG flagellin family)
MNRKKASKNTALALAAAVLISALSFQVSIAGETLSSVQEKENKQPTLENIQEIKPGIVLKGEIGQKEDDGYVDGGDVLRLVLPSDGILTMNFSIHDNGNSSVAYFDVMSGINGGYYFVIRDQTTDRNPQDATAFLKAGTYYIAVASKNDGAFDYALELAFEAVKFFDKEPNENESQAIAIAPGGAAGGSIGFLDINNSRDGTDFYSVKITEPGKLKITLDAYGPDGLVLGLSFSNRDWPANDIKDVKPGSPGSMTTDTLMPGTYWINLGGFIQLSDTVGGSYKITTTFYPKNTPKEVSAQPTNATVTVDGKIVAFQAYNIGGSNYFKLRDLAYALKDSEKPFEATWDAEQGAIVLATGKPYTVAGGELTITGGTVAVTAKPSLARLVADDLQRAASAYTIGGNNYFKLRDLAAIVDFSVEWDSVNQTVAIDTAKGYTTP